VYKKYYVLILFFILLIAFLLFIFLFKRSDVIKNNNTTQTLSTPDKQHTSTFIDPQGIKNAIFIIEPQGSIYSNKDGYFLPSKVDGLELLIFLGESNNQILFEEKIDGTINNKSIVPDELAKMLVDKKQITITVPYEVSDIEMVRKSPECNDYCLILLDQITKYGSNTNRIVSGSKNIQNRITIGPVLKIKL
jgi:hypothetical protein